MNKSWKLSVEDLKLRWEYLIWECGIYELLVTERFNDGLENVYVVSGLTMELEHNMAFCRDYKDVLFNSSCILRMFLQNNLKTITLLPYKDWYKEELVFSNRIIYIEKVS